ncbi:MAG TPA: hypothetical protein VF950_03880 [Planctomycetota bacterium]
MRKKLAAVLAFLALAPLGAAPSDFMLCFHRDGKIAVEAFQELCCKSACPEDRGQPCPKELPEECPDDQCHDVPLAFGAKVVQPGPSALPSLAPLEGGLVADLPASIPVLAHEDPKPLARTLGPPGSLPLSRLRTVVLRQ